MGNNVASRLLLLVIAILAASLVGTIAGWVTSVIEQSFGKALLVGGGAFGATLALFIATFNFVTRGDA
ncbi:hypothetical protein GA0074692_4107 [Micromonospora pallida]|uniref:Uncharacterized protein n=1 Tax=Micromonospora pallida TaxID=145854 RepID=A0A1C6T2A0_9ACTN|nr:hypothetical protein [Micromonospora pallida]SCL35495.1 hypothetical protein GA0074692_4107 [Micromonospora pallida]